MMDGGHGNGRVGLSGATKTIRFLYPHEGDINGGGWANKQRLLKNGEMVGGFERSDDGELALVLGVGAKGPSIGGVDEAHALELEERGIRGAVELTLDYCSDGAQFTNKSAPMTNLRKTEATTVLES
jgi:hypothetical protein